MTTGSSVTSEVAESFERTLDQTTQTELDAILDGGLTPEATPVATPVAQPTPDAQGVLGGQQANQAAPTPATPGAETPPAETVVPQPNLEADQLRAQLQVEQQARIGLQRAQEDQQLHQSMVKMQADDNAAIMDSLRAQATGLKQQGYEDQTIRDILNPVKEKMEATATYRRDALTAQELAFTYGQRYNLNVEQVRQLTQAPDPDTFKSTLAGFVNTAPTAREQELTAETQRAQAALAAKDVEIDALKKQVVPNGQTFGNLGGVGQAPVGDMGTMMKGNLDSGQPLSEEAGKAFDAWMADDKLW